jgi:hypothetical protein
LLGFFCFSDIHNVFVESNLGGPDDVLKVEFSAIDTANPETNAI